MVCAGVLAPAIFARDSAIWPKTSFSCCAIPFVVSTRFGMRSLRRCSWFSTCAHCALMLSSWLTNVLYEQPEEMLAPAMTSASTSNSQLPTPNFQIPSAECFWDLGFGFWDLGFVIMGTDYHPAPAPPPPLRPPPKPPN